jgi:hypothetical protein
MTTAFGGLFGLAFGFMAGVAAMVAVIVAVLAVLTGFAALITAATAYWKRESWTKPAYRWTRDRTGRWRFTPWSGGEDGQNASPSTDEAAAPGRHPKAA